MPRWSLSGCYWPLHPEAPITTSPAAQLASFGSPLAPAPLAPATDWWLDEDGDGLVGAAINPTPTALAAALNGISFPSLPIPPFLFWAFSSATAPTPSRAALALPATAVTGSAVAPAATAATGSAGQERPGAVPEKAVRPEAATVPLAVRRPWAPGWFGGLMF